MVLLFVFLQHHSIQTADAAAEDARRRVLGGVVLQERGVWHVHRADQWAAHPARWFNPPKGSCCTCACVVSLEDVLSSVLCGSEVFMPVGRGSGALLLVIL